MKPKGEKIIKDNIHAEQERKRKEEQNAVKAKKLINNQQKEVMTAPQTTKAWKVGEAEPKKEHQQLARNADPAIHHKSQASMKPTQQQEPPTEKPSSREMKP